MVTKRAPFCEDWMSSVQAIDMGWLARSPIGRPSTVARAVTRLGAHWPRSSSVWVLSFLPLVLVWVTARYCGYGTSRLLSATVALFRNCPGNLSTVR